MKNINQIKIIQSFSKQHEGVAPLFLLRLFDSRTGTCETNERIPNIYLLLEKAILGVPGYATEMCANGT